MSTTAPLQTDRKAWAKTRIGKFTGSTNAVLLTEPKSKADKDAGRFSQGAQTLIATKATEIYKGSEVRDAWDWSMKRGFVLEAAFKYLLSKYWEPVDDCTMQEDGIWVATPDLLKRTGEPGDIKCTNEVDVLLFATEVPDGDWEALKRWDKKYAYQLATQARACGVRHASLIYCTDAIKTIALDEDDVRMLHGEGLHDEHGGIIGDACQRLFDETGSMFTYTFHDAYDKPGFTYVVRRFEIPQDEIDALEAALVRAYAARDAKVQEFRIALAPTPEAVEAEVADLLEGQDIETDEQHDVRRLEELAHHLADMPWPTECKTELAAFTVRKVREHISASQDMIKGTITKDLRRKPATTRSNGHHK